MAERKHKRASMDTADLDEDAGTLYGPAQIELGLGYTLAVSYDENARQLVDLKTYGHVDLEQLRREIGRLFPNAQIRQRTAPETVTVTNKCKRKLRAHRKRSR
jgi:Flp pilus assembly secretin CpaC